MNEQELNNLACEISSMCIFRGLLQRHEMKSFLNFLKSDWGSFKRINAYGEFVYSLADYNYSFSSFLECAVCEDENQYIIDAAKKKESPEFVKQNAQYELALLSRLTELSPKTLWKESHYSGYIPQFENHPIDFINSYNERIANIESLGYGIFATAGMFKVENGKIVPIKSADKVTTDSFVGYEEQRKKLMDNTRALIDGRPAANALLFGDAGTGKSSSVKACANYFYDKGLRLIELRKDQLFSLSDIMGRIADNPLKFIIFIDDLSFNKNDDCFSMLKAALEGSASTKTENAVIYATSNRRHIVKERFSDRETSDDIHHSDTVQELMSLSDRFGLTIYFSQPNKALYLDIVHELAKKNGINLKREELDIKAEAFALSRANRSPRAAEQFIKSLM